jgi:type I restriction enzyme S subunit
VGIIADADHPPLGKVSLITDEYKEWNTNQAVAIYRVLNQRHRSYLLYYLLSDFAQKWFYLRSKQTSGQVNLTLEMCSNLEIPLPKDDTELTSISNILAQVSKKINVENDFRIKLLKKKSGLMHDLLTGKVQVKIDQEEVVHV